MDIIDIIREVVERVSSEVTIRQSDKDGNVTERVHPFINYLFGSDQYIKDTLDTWSKSAPKSNKSAGDTSGEKVKKFPLVALFVPFTEQYGDPAIYCKASISVLIACSSRQEWSNEKRKETSFENILKPIYDRFIEELGRHDFVKEPYSGCFVHEKQDNYSYGRYGAYTQSGESVSEPIDAIVIRNLKLEIFERPCNRL